MINESNSPMDVETSPSTVDTSSRIISSEMPNQQQQQQMKDNCSPVAGSSSTCPRMNQSECTSCTVANDTMINDARDNTVRPSDTSVSGNDCINSVSSNDSQLTSGHFLTENHSSHHQQQQQAPQCHNNSTVRTGSTSIASSSASSTVSHDNPVHTFHTDSLTSPVASTSRFNRSYLHSNLHHHQQQQQQQQQQRFTSHESEDDNVRTAVSEKHKHLKHKQKQKQQQHQQPATHANESANQGAMSGNSCNNYSYLINIPGINLPLSANDPSIKTIKQHYYPEGAWGWVVLAVASFVHFITAALTPTSGLLIMEIINYFSPDQGVVSAVFLGALSTCVTLLTSPIFIAICKKKSLRLTAILGGLIAALGCLFTSFATQFHQLFFSLSIVMAIGVSMINVPAVMIVGSYFKKKRALVEIALHCSQGLGFAFMPLFLTFCIRGKNWRFGLQCIALVIVVAFFLATLYRPASLYHPQRRAILHLKSLQKRSRVKDEHLRMQGQSSIGSAGTTAATINTHNNPVHHSTSQRHQSTSSAGVSGHMTRVTDKSIGFAFDKAYYFDFSVLKSRTVQIILSGTCISYFGMTGPIFLTALMGKSDGLDYASLMRLQIYFGLSSVLGVLVFALIIVKNSVQCLISRQYLCQSSSLILAISSLAFTGFNDYSGYVLFSCIYGFFYGGYQYSLKMFIFDKVRARNFNRAWGFLQVSQSLPLLFGMPIIMLLNDHFSSKIGFYLSSACLALGSIVFFLIDAHKASKSRSHAKNHKKEHSYSMEKDTATFNGVDHHGHHHRHNLLTSGNMNNETMLNGINLMTINDINSIYHAQNPLFRRSSSSSTGGGGGGSSSSCRPMDGLMSTQARILHNYLRSLTHDSSRSLGASLEPSSNNSTVHNVSVGKVSPCRLNNLSNSTMSTHNIHSASGINNGNSVCTGYKVSAARSSRSNSLDPALCELTCISEEVNFLDDLNDMWDTDSTTVDAMDGKMSNGLRCPKSGLPPLDKATASAARLTGTMDSVHPMCPTTSHPHAYGPSDGNASTNCGKSEKAKTRLDTKCETIRDADCSLKGYDGEQSQDESSHFLMLIEKRKQQLLRAASAMRSTSVAPSHSNGTSDSNLNENSDKRNESRDERQVNSGDKRSPEDQRQDVSSGMRADECISCHRCGKGDADDVNDSIINKLSRPDEKMKGDGSTSVRSKGKSNAQRDNDGRERCTEKSLEEDERDIGVKLSKIDSQIIENSKSCLCNDKDDIFTTASHIIIQESSSESEDEEIRKIMCAKKLTSNGESIYRKMTSAQCESMSDDEDDDDDDTTLPNSLDRSESTAYKQQDTTIVYFTRRDQLDSPISPQLNEPSGDSRDPPVLASTSPSMSIRNDSIAARSHNETC